MSLSDKIQTQKKNEKIILIDPYLYAHHVREKVKELKEEFKAQSESPRDLITSVYGVYRIREIIDKIFGEKLI